MRREGPRAWRQEGLLAGPGVQSQGTGPPGAGGAREGPGPGAVDGPGVLRSEIHPAPLPQLGTGRSVVRAGALVPKILWEQPGGPWMGVGTSCLLSFSPFPGCLAQGDMASLSFFPAGGWSTPLGVPSPLGCAASLTHCGTGPKPQSQLLSPLSWRGNLRPRGEGLRAAAGACPGPRAMHPPPSRNQLPKHPACGPLTPWLPGLEEGPLVP